MTTRREFLRMNVMPPELVRPLQTAYSAERAASFAYIGHARSLRNPAEKQRVQEIEADEWAHRRNVLAIMQQYDIPVSRFLEARYYIIGKLIGASCHVIGRFMPYFFAGKLESGNVCEYFVMLRHFHDMGVTAHDDVLHEMGIKEKEHEVYFLKMIQHEAWLPWFERVFAWGAGTSLNDVDLDVPQPVARSDQYCRTRPAKWREGARR